MKFCLTRYVRATAICVALGLLTFGPLASAATTLALGTANAGPGEAALVDVVFNSDTTAAALQVDVRFDATRFEPGISEATALTAAHLISGGSPSPGLYRLVIYSLSNRPLPNGALARLAFRGRTGAAAGTYALAVSNLVVATPTATRVTAATATPGSINLRATGGPRFLVPTLGANGTTSLRLDGVAGRTYALQYSTDLTRWTPLSSATANATDGRVTFTDTPVPAARFRFYRAMETP